MFVNYKFSNILEEFSNKKNSHSYMFYTNDFFSCKEDIINLVKIIFGVDNLNQINSDFLVIERSEKKNILKDDIDNVKTFFQTTSYINRVRIYLVEEAHKLNSTSANMILKFLEEPLDGVIGLFITTNLDAVLPTIKSRCQIINVFYKDIDDSYKENEIKNIKSIFIENKYINLFSAKKKFEKFDRNQLINMFDNYLLFCYKDLTSQKNLKMIKIMNNAIGLLNNNVSVDYVLDYLLLESGE